MSLINQMLQDLDAQQGNAKQPAVAELVATSRKGRAIGLPGMLGLLLAAALGAGMSWVLGRADGAGRHRRRGALLRGEQHDGTITGHEPEAALRAGLVGS